MIRAIRYFDSSGRAGYYSTKEEVYMKLFATAVLAATLALSGSMAFAQTNDSMSHDTMSKDSMSKDTMSKDGMSHDSMAKNDGKMKKHDAMGMDHPASGAMAQ
jgi:pentapeptide MXKDX repeat protein